LVGEDPREGDQQYMNDALLYSNLQRIDLGNGVAEHDNLLWACMVETQHFTDFLFD